MFEYACQVRDVIDGDTVKLNIDLGFRVWMRATVRLADINAPERGEIPAGPEATAHLKSLLDGKTELRITTTRFHEFEKYGRVLGLLIADGVNINKQMVTDGFAQER